MRYRSFNAGRLSTMLLLAGFLGLAIAICVVFAHSRTTTLILIGIVAAISWIAVNWNRRDDRLLFVRAYLVVIPVFNVFREVGLIHLPFGIIVTPAALGLLGVILVTGLRILRISNERKGLMAAQRSKFSGWITLLAVVLTVSALAATLFAQSVPTNDRTTFLAWSLFLDGVVLPMVFLVEIAIPGLDGGDLRKLAGAVILSVVSAMVVGTTFIKLGFSAPTQAISSGNAVATAGILRTYAKFSYGNEDLFAFIAALAIPLGFAMSTITSSYRRVAWIIATILIIIGEVITFSRGGLIGSVLGVVTFIVLYRPNRVRIIIALAAVGAVVFSNQGAKELLLARFTQTGVALSQPIQARTKAFHLGWHEIFTNPLGIGGAGFGQVWLHDGQDQPILQSPHNLLLAVAVEYGALAGVAFIAIIALALASSVSACVRSNATDALAAGICASLFSGLVTGVLTGIELSHLSGKIPLATPTILFLSVTALAIHSGTSSRRASMSNAELVPV